MSLKGIAKETLAIQDGGSYTTPAGKTVSIAAAQSAAVAGTVLYAPDRLAELTREPVPTGGPAVRVSVTDERTQTAARRLVEEEGLDDPAVLNFASARNVGGGFITGARAQEEDVVRCCGLYRCLETQREYYARNREQRSLLYTDHIIYTPRVPWFRPDSRDLLEEPFLASVISAPAPNAGEHLRRHPDDREGVTAALRRRAEYVLAVARDQGHRALLLGAWGCGVFRNRPDDVASAFGDLLEGRFAHAFETVAFGVYDTTRDQSTLAAFRRRFQG